MYNNWRSNNPNAAIGDAMATLVGKTVGKYKLLKLLGRGGMAEVYKARHPTLDRDVTVKILHRHLADGEGFLARFEREAKAVAAMRHPHIVQIFDYEAAEDANYMVMEFIDGGTLQDRMSLLAKEGKFLPVREILSILKQVGEALDYAHGRGILHRDVKPSNILLDTSGNAFLTDFGIARILSGAQYTATGVMIGTPAYMSPEQGTGEELTAASDLYSLGVILYELLAGKVPFTSDTTPLAVIHKHVHEPPPGLRAVRRNLPAAVEEVVLRVLAKNPKDRFRSAGEFIRELERVFPGNVIRALDETEGRESVPVSKQPTMLMEEEAAPSRAHMVTEVMGIAPPEEEPRLEPEIRKIPEPVRSEPAVEGKPIPTGKPHFQDIGGTDSPERETRVPAAGPSGALQPKLEAVMASVRGLLKTRRGQIAVVGLAAVIVLAVGGWFLFGRSSALFCSSVEECIAQAQELRMQGDLPGFVDRMNAAIDHVPGDQHPPNAGLWCEKGEAERELGRGDAAIGSFTNCIEWTEGDPGLQELRNRAEEALRGLR
jgi:serine/threonine protein kinase